MVKEIKEKVQKEERITIQDMVEEISLDLWKFGIDLHKVTESFINKKKHTYLVRYMKLEQEKGMVFGSDLDKIIEDNRSILMGFLKSSVKRVSKFKSDDTDMICYKIYWKDGYTLIESIIS